MDLFAIPTRGDFATILSRSIRKNPIQINSSVAQNQVDDISVSTSVGYL